MCPGGGISMDNSKDGHFMGVWVLLQGDCEVGESPEVWDQNRAVGRGVRHHQLSSTVADTAHWGRKEPSKWRQTDHVWWKRGGKLSREKNKGKGDVTELAKWFWILSSLFSYSFHSCMEPHFEAEQQLWAGLWQTLVPAPRDAMSHQLVTNLLQLLYHNQKGVKMNISWCDFSM